MSWNGWYAIWWTVQIQISFIKCIWKNIQQRFYLTFTKCFLKHVLWKSIKTNWYYWALVYRICMFYVYMWFVFSQAPKSGCAFFCCVLQNSKIYLIYALFLLCIYCNIQPIMHPLLSDENILDVSSIELLHGWGMKMTLRLILSPWQSHSRPLMWKLTLTYASKTHPSVDVVGVSKWGSVGRSEP